MHKMEIKQLSLNNEVNNGTHWEIKIRLLTSEQIWIGDLPQPCFFRGRGFKEIICWAWKELDNNLRCVTGVVPLCFAGTTDKLPFAWSPSHLLASEIPEKGSILWLRVWGIGLIAAIFGFCWRTPPFTPPKTLYPDGLVSWHGPDLFRLAGGAINQLGGLGRIELFWLSCLACLVQKKRRRSASSFSKEATDKPWMLAIPRVTKLR